MKLDPNRLTDVQRRFLKGAAKAIDTTGAKEIVQLRETAEQHGVRDAFDRALITRGDRLRPLVLDLSKASFDATTLQALRGIAKLLGFDGSFEAQMAAAQLDSSVSHDIMLTGEAERLLAGMDALAARARQSGGVLTPQAKDEVDALGRDAATLDELAREHGTTLAALLAVQPPAGPAVVGAAALRAVREIDRGLLAVTVPTRADAEEVLHEMLRREPLVDTTGMNARIGRVVLDSKSQFHWDEAFLAAHKGAPPILEGHEQAAVAGGHGLRDATTPHLQLHLRDGRTVHVFFKPPDTGRSG